MFARILPASVARQTGAGGLLAVRAHFFEFGRLVSPTECAASASSSRKVRRSLSRASARSSTRCARRSAREKTGPHFLVGVSGKSADGRAARLTSLLPVSGPKNPVAAGNPRTSLLELGAAQVAPDFRGAAA